MKINNLESEKIMPICFGFFCPLILNKYLGFYCINILFELKTEEKRLQLDEVYLSNSGETCWIA